MKLSLPQATLLGIDCVNVERLQAALDASESGIEFGAVKLLTSLPTGDARLVAIPAIDTIEEYSRFCIEELHKYVDTEYVIMIQYDGFILHPELWKQEFLDYDYIGGPMFTTAWKGRPDIPLPTPLIVGNGGFTLRSKKLLEIGAQLVADGTITHTAPEDVAISYWHRKDFEAAGMKYPSVELAKQFCVNAKYQDEYIKGFGFHGFYVKNMEAVLEAFPAYPMHFFLPRIRWARLMQLKNTFAPIALKGEYTVEQVHGEAPVRVWLTFAGDTINDAWAHRLEHMQKAGEIIEQSEEGHTIRFTVKTRAGLIPLTLIFQKASEAVSIEGAKQFLP
ncbi:MAG: DUF5672 family protein [Patescibacteria group bacterium]